MKGSTTNFLYRYVDMFLLTNPPGRQMFYLLVYRLFSMYVKERIIWYHIGTQNYLIDQTGETMFRDHSLFERDWSNRAAKTPIQDSRWCKGEGVSCDLIVFIYKKTCRDMEHLIDTVTDQKITQLSLFM